MRLDLKFAFSGTMEVVNGLGTVSGSDLPLQAFGIR